MAWIRVIEPGAAEGLLARIYKGARERAGRVFNVVALQSLQPRILQSSTRLYADVMRTEEGPLSRAQRELIATVVSRENECFY